MLEEGERDEYTSSNHVRYKNEDMHVDDWIVFAMTTCVLLIEGNKTSKKGQQLIETIWNIKDWFKKKNKINNQSKTLNKLKGL